MKKFIKYFFLAFLLIVTLIPFIMLVTFSFRPHLDIVINFWGNPFSNIKFENYIKAANVVLPSMLNSVFVSCVTLMGVLVLGSLSGFIFAKNKFPLKNLLYTLIIGVLAIPSLLTIVPLYSIILKLKITNSYWGLILPYISGQQLFATILCRTFFESLPEELFDSAKIDGANDFLIYKKIAMPLCIPTLITCSIVTFLAVYNDFLWPSIILNNEKQTFAMAAISLNSSGRQDIGLSFAGYVIGSLPTLLVLLFGMKYYIEGMISGAIKG